MFAVEMREDATNSRVIGFCYQSVSSEPYGSNFGWFVSRRDRSDPAAHGKHSAQLKRNRFKALRKFSKQVSM